MRILGLTEPSGAPVLDYLLEHGADPYVASHHRGYAVLRPLEAALVEDEITLSLLVEPVQDHLPPQQAERGRDSGLLLRPGEVPRVRQRVAAYVLVRSERGLLATEFSDRTAVPGRWGLPGGGMDPGETPTESVLREVAEETGQQVSLGELRQIQTSHWVGRAPDGTVEDFHAVRLIYRASCDLPTEPVVADVGGTTESARWLPLAQWRSVNWTVGWRRLLEAELD
ncbi:hypothetical protein GCM10009841_33770 [Microlunatus panaciterrae]|uniref:8-oxo-dGTP pyrophosphatase MutT (NUDIX family) n=1 Tax=Microlunatus panaciterrae TaxID=400768 RepID=A0ABS2RGA7_9ACTN|nr:NUDIX domain-containing protein [Microlunatus panaciterrae]MBM7798036.1 8-oxo-dGTP pyrophosphatase MutT (NUDIX family) [Microlunatus panaciterrae]